MEFTLNNETKMYRKRNTARSIDELNEQIRSYEYSITNDRRSFDEKILDSFKGEDQRKHDQYKADLALLREINEHSK